MPLVTFCSPPVKQEKNIHLPLFKVRFLDLLSIMFLHQTDTVLKITFHYTPGFILVAFYFAVL